MTEALQRRLDLAGRVAKALRVLPAVQAACACGSVALGLADEAADVDLALVCSPGVPAPEARQKLYRGLADNHEEAAVDCLGAGTFDCLKVDGVQVEIEFHTQQELSEGIRRALAATSCERSESFTGFGRLPCAILSDIASWRILFEKDGAVSDLKGHVRYPEGLRRLILQQGRFLDDPHIVYEYERACLRGDAVYAIRCQGKILDHFTQIVFALNRTYCPGDKWLHHFIRAFKVVPEGFQGQFAQFLALGNDPAGLERKRHLAHRLFRGLRDLVRIELGKEGG